MTAVLHRLNPGNYVTDRDEPVGSYVVYRYENDRGRSDGWMICRHELTDRGHKDLVSIEWAPTLAEARHCVTWYQTQNALASRRSIA